MSFVSAWSRFCCRLGHLRVTYECIGPLGLDRPEPHRLDGVRIALTPRRPGLRRVECRGAAFRSRVRLLPRGLRPPPFLLRPAAGLRLRLGLRVRPKARGGRRHHTHLRRVLRPADQPLLRRRRPRQLAQGHACFLVSSHLCSLSAPGCIKAFASLRTASLPDPYTIGEMKCLAFH
jgi:hypothetical protein